MRALSLAALILGVLLIPSALGIARQDQAREVSQLERRLVAQTDEHTARLRTYFDRARAIILLTANAPAFANALAAPGGRAEVLRANGRSIREIRQQLLYLETLYPNSVGEACVIDSNGEEWARVVEKQIAPRSDLSTVEEQNAFFAPSLALRSGQTHQSRPYISADNGKWVVENIMYKTPNKAGMEAIDKSMLDKYPNMAMAPADLLKFEQLRDLGDGMKAFSKTVSEIMAAK